MIALALQHPVIVVLVMGSNVISAQLPAQSALPVHSESLSSGMFIWKWVVMVAIARSNPTRYLSVLQSAVMLIELSRVA